MPETGLRAAAFSAEMTPPVGVPMAGFPQLSSIPQGYDGYEGRKDVSQGTHDPLLATALAVEVGQRTALVITLDVCKVGREFTRAVRMRLSEIGIAPEAVLLAASHTHSGPHLLAADTGPSREVWMRALDAVVAAAEGAVGFLQPAEARWGTGDIDYLSINRIHENDGPLETTVRVLTFRAMRDDRPIAVLVHFACHPLTLGPPNLLFSADFVAYLRNTLNSIFPGASVLFLNGAAGDIQPGRFPYELRANISFSEKYPKNSAWGSYREAARFGRCLAGEALQAIERAVPLSIDCLAYARRPVRVPLRPTGELGRFIALFEGGPELGLGRWTEPDAGHTEIQAMRLGDLLIVGLPGEPFVDVGRRIARRCAAEAAAFMLVGYANDDIRYILPEEFYDRTCDRYELIGTPLAQDAARVLDDAAAALIAGMGARASEAAGAAGP